MSNQLIIQQISTSNSDLHNGAAVGSAVGVTVTACITVFKDLSFSEVSLDRNFTPSLSKFNILEGRKGRRV
jgi:hypothetical protein